MSAELCTTTVAPYNAAQLSALLPAKSELLLSALHHIRLVSRSAFFDPTSRSCLGRPRTVLRRSFHPDTTPPMFSHRPPCASHSSSPSHPNSDPPTSRTTSTIALANNQYLRHDGYIGTVISWGGRRARISPEYIASAQDQLLFPVVVYNAQRWVCGRAGGRPQARVPPRLGQWPLAGSNCTLSISLAATSTLLRVAEVRCSSGILSTIGALEAHLILLCRLNSTFVRSYSSSVCRQPCRNAVRFAHRLSLKA